MEQALALARADTLSKIGDDIPLPEVKVHTGLFKGRYADLEHAKDKLLGLEFATDRSALTLYNDSARRSLGHEPNPAFAPPKRARI